MALLKKKKKKIFLNLPYNEIPKGYYYLVLFQYKIVSSRDHRFWVGITDNEFFVFC